MPRFIQSRMSVVWTAILVTVCGAWGACGGGETREASPPAAAASSAAPAARPALVGVQSFVIVPEQSKASYIATEEFFALALSKFGIPAGTKEAVGTTQAIEGRFEFDPEKPIAAAGGNTFTVRMNTLTTTQSMRDNYIRTNGPRFNDYPLATFKATSIESAPGAYRSGDDFAFKLLGDLTVRAITKPATFDVKAKLTGDTLTGVAKATGLHMSEFGIEQLTFANTLTVADAFDIEVQFTARAEAK